jgi:hypothetical protein
MANMSGTTTRWNDAHGDPHEARFIARRRALYAVAEHGVRDGAQHEPHLLQREQPSRRLQLRAEEAVSREDPGEGQGVRNEDQRLEQEAARQHDQRAGARQGELRVQQHGRQQIVEPSDRVGDRYECVETHEPRIPEHHGDEKRPEQDARDETGERELGAPRRARRDEETPARHGVGRDARHSAWSGHCPTERSGGHPAAEVLKAESGAIVGPNANGRCAFLRRLLDLRPTRARL